MKRLILSLFALLFALLLAAPVLGSPPVCGPVSWCPPGWLKSAPATACSDGEAHVFSSSAPACTDIATQAELDAIDEGDIASTGADGEILVSSSGGLVPSDASAPDIVIGDGLSAATAPNLNIYEALRIVSTYTLDSPSASWYSAAFGGEVVVNLPSGLGLGVSGSFHAYAPATNASTGSSQLYGISSSAVSAGGTFTNTIGHGTTAGLTGGTASFVRGSANTGANLGGTITGFLVGVNAEKQVSGGTTAYAMGLRVREVYSSGSVTNNVGIAIDSTAMGTNNTALLMCDWDGYSTGNWAIDSVCTYPSRLNGHLKLASGAQLSSAGADPALSACGTTPTISGSDLAGRVTIGSGTITSCTVTFASAYTAAPACMVTGSDSAVQYAATTTTTALTLTSSADMSADVVSYSCIGIE